MGLGIHGAPAAAAAIVVVLAALFHHHHWWPRFTSWLFGFAAMLATISVTAWLDALAGLTATGTGITVLIAMVLICAALCYRHMDKRHHHPVWSSAIFIVAGVVIVVTIGSFRLIMENMGRSMKGSGAALGQAITNVNSGQAAHAVPSGSRWGILLWGVAIFAALVIVGRVRHNKSGGRRPAASGPRSITSGAPQGHASGSAAGVPARRG